MSEGDGVAACHPTSLQVSPLSVLETFHTLSEVLVAKICECKLLLIEKISDTEGTVHCRKLVIFRRCVVRS